MKIIQKFMNRKKLKNLKRLKTRILKIRSWEMKKQKKIHKLLQKNQKIRVQIPIGIHLIQLDNSTKHKTKNLQKTKLVTTGIARSFNLHSKVKLNRRKLLTLLHVLNHFSPQIFHPSASTSLWDKPAEMEMIVSTTILQKIRCLTLNVDAAHFIVSRNKDVIEINVDSHIMMIVDQRLRQCLVSIVNITNEKSFLNISL